MVQKEYYYSMHKTHLGTNTVRPVVCGFYLKKQSSCWPTQIPLHFYNLAFRLLHSCSSSYLLFASSFLTMYLFPYILFEISIQTSYEQYTYF